MTPRNQHPRSQAMDLYLELLDYFCLSLVDSFCYSGPSSSLTLEADKEVLVENTHRSAAWLFGPSGPIIMGIHGRQLSILSLPYRCSLCSL